MAYTSKNELTHGLGYGVVFLDPTGSTTGIPIAGLRAVETETKQDNKSFYAGFNAPYRTIAGAKNTEIKVKSYDLPDKFADHALGFGIFGEYLTDDPKNYKPYGFAYAERYRDDDGTGYKGQQVFRLQHQATRQKRTKKVQRVKNTNTLQL